MYHSKERGYLLGTVVELLDGGCYKLSCKNRAPAELGS